MENSIEIQNIYLAAALLAYKFHYVGVNRIDTRHQKFVFSDLMSKTIFVLGPKPEEIITLPSSSVRDVEQFFMAESLLYPPTYPEAMRRVKYILHSSDDNGNERTGKGSDPMLSNRKPIGEIG